MKHLASSFVLLVLTSVSDAKESLGILEIYDQFHMASYAASRCSSPDSETLSKFLFNFKIVSSRATEEIKKNDPNGANLALQRRGKEIEKRVATVIEKSGCDAPSVLDLLTRFTIQANLGPLGDSGAPPVNSASTDSLGEITELIKLAKWRNAALSLYRAALTANFKSIETLLSMARTGFIDEAVSASSAMTPDTQSFLLYKIASENTALPEKRRLELLGRAVQVVQNVNIRANLKTDALANVATTYSLLNQNQKATAVIKEALRIAIDAPVEDQSVALRAICDSLERSQSPNIHSLLPIGEEAAQHVTDPFHKSFSYVAIAKAWQRVGSKDAASRWVQEGIRQTESIQNTNQQKLARNAFAEASALLGDFSIADTQIARREGTFIDVLARKLVVIAAERGEYTRALTYVTKIANDCERTFSVRGFALLDLITLQAKRGDIDDAQNAIKFMDGCSRRFIGEAWIELGKARKSAGQNRLEIEAYRKAGDTFDAKEGKSFSEHDIRALISVADAMLSAKQAPEALKLINQARSECQRMAGSVPDAAIDLLGRTAVVYARSGDARAATDSLIEAVQIAQGGISKKALTPTDLSRSLTKLGMSLVTL